MPDLDLVTGADAVRVFEFLQKAEPVLLTFGEPIDVAHVHSINATYAGTWELPVVGRVAAPSAVLVRPDGHVAWVGEGSDAGLGDALAKWFGTPS
jgi:hypothetical protein